MRTFNTDKPLLRIALLAAGALIGFCTGVIASMLLGGVLLKW